MRSFTAPIGLTLVLALLMGTHVLDARESRGEITRVKYEEYLPEKQRDTADPMISFEEKFLVYGAIQPEDYMARRGRYFTILWKAQGPPEEFRVRFEYLQQNTGATIHVREVVPEKVKRSNTTRFNIIGKEFEQKGNVLAWRASLLMGGEVVDSEQSYLWAD